MTPPSNSIPLIAVATELGEISARRNAESSSASKQETHGATVDLAQAAFVPRRKRGEVARNRTKGRVLGPYREPNNTFRVIHVTARGTRDSFCFATEEEAARAIEALRVEVAQPDPILQDVLRDYATYMRDDKGNKPNSVDQTLRKLRRFFPDQTLALSELTPDRCADLYLALRVSPKKNGEGKLSVDFHRNALSEARTFLKWCVKKTLIDRNPLEDVEGVGRRKHGKEQLRIDEARKWLAKARELADQEFDGAIAAMMTLLMGMRCSEVISRVVRDIDDNGTLLWIPDSKTEKGKRTLRVPEMLRPYLRVLANGKKPGDLLFGHRDRGWPRHWVQRICGEAEVPEVTAHGQRGLHSTLAVEAGETSRAVADALGHESFATTARSYAQPEAVGNARQARALRVLDGGKAHAA